MCRVTALVTTFYSYKGGVGRTMAVANIAVVLANRGHRVILWDMDLESPGLHHYFYKNADHDDRLTNADLGDRIGTLDLLEQYLDDEETPPDPISCLIPCWHPRLLKGSIRLFPPGRLNEGYQNRLADFPWRQLYEERHGYALMEYIREQLTVYADADYILVDSRTGLTDISSICTAQLPDVLVILFALNAQGIDGSARIAHMVRQLAQKDGFRARLRYTLLQPSRVDLVGATASRIEMLTEAQNAFRGLPPEFVRRLDYNEWIPYDPDMAFRESVVVSPELDAARTPLIAAYENLADQCREPNNRPRITPVNTKIDIKSRVTRIVDGVATLDELAANIAAGEGVIETISLQANRLSRTNLILAAELFALNDDLARLFIDKGQTHSAPYAAPKTISDWKALSETLQTDDPVKRYRQERQNFARQQLASIVLQQDEPLVEQALQELEASFDLAPAEFQEAVQRAGRKFWLDTVQQHLSEGKLELPLLSRGGLKDLTVQQNWLVERTERFFESEFADNGAKIILENLLTLLIQVKTFDHKVVWEAYDLQCSLVIPDDSVTHQRLFDQVGKALWLDLWKRRTKAFSENEPWNASAPGKDAVLHLQSALESSDGANEIVDAARSWVTAVAENTLGQYRLRQNVIEPFADDPALSWAILKFSQDTTLPLINRRELISTYCLITMRKDRPELAIDAFFRVMVESHYVAEAVIVLCAVHPWLTQRSLQTVARVLLSYILVSLKDTRAGEGEVNRALADYNILNILMDDSWGVIFLHGLALGRGNPSLPDDQRQGLWGFLKNRGNQLEKQTQQFGLPSFPDEYLSELERHVAQQIEDLNKIIVESSDGTIYREWKSSVYWEEAHKKFWQNRAQKLMGTRICSLEQINEAPSLDSWIQRTYPELKKKHSDAHQLDGKGAIRNLKTHYEAAQKAEKQWIALANAEMKKTGEQLIQQLDGENKLWDQLVDQIQQVDSPEDVVRTTLKDWMGVS